MEQYRKISECKITWIKFNRKNWILYKFIITVHNIAKRFRESEENSVQMTWLEISIGTLSEITVCEHSLPWSSTKALKLIIVERRSCM